MAPPVIHWESPVRDSTLNSTGSLTRLTNLSETEYYYYMKPVIARKTTTCHYCKEHIEPGSQRFTDVFPAKNSPGSNGTKQYITRHFHHLKSGQEKSCLELWALEIFAELPTRFKSNNPRGRPSLGLSPENTEKRSKLLKKLQNQIRYYITQGNLDLTKPQFIIDVTPQDIRRVARFKKNIEETLEALKTVGGIPDKYVRYVKEPK
jgi:hypothetical protein